MPFPHRVTANSSRGGAMPSKGQQQQQQNNVLELHVQCRNLPKQDTFSQSDPFCVIHRIREGSRLLKPKPQSMPSQTTTGQRNVYSVNVREDVPSFESPPPRNPDIHELEIGRTETIMDSPNPDFVQPIRLEYHFEEKQMFCLRVFDEDERNSPVLKHHDFLGGFCFTIGQLLRSKGSSMTVPLGKGKGFCVLQAEMTNKSMDNDVLEFLLSGNNLMKCDGPFGKSDPFYLLQRQNPDGSTWTTVHKSAVIRNTLNPIWEPDAISLLTLCHNDYHRPLRIQLFDWDRDGSHDDMGCVETNLAELVFNGRNTHTSSAARSAFITMQVLHKRKKRLSRNEKVTKAGTLTMQYARIVKKYSMLDYIRGGCELNLMVAVDFTLSNGQPHDPKSLHFLNGQKPNEYQEAISKIGNVLEDYDTDKLFPIWGFGAKFVAANGDSSRNGGGCFSLTSHEVYGVEGLLTAYNRTFCTPGFSLSGPTNFRPVLNEAYRRAMASVESNIQEYSVLMILTDGVASDWKATIEGLSLIAERAPLSIVIIGVGKTDFGVMEYLNEENIGKIPAPTTSARDRQAIMAIPEFTRSVVRFVPYRRFGHSNTERLAAEVLRDIPKQVVEYFDQQDVPPNPPLPARSGFQEDFIFDD